MSDTGETAHAALNAATQADEHLRRAELEVSWLRWLGMASCALILLRDEFTVDPRVAWLIYAGGVLYTALAHRSAVFARNIAVTARLTTLGDPLIAALMCSVTGGIDSIFYPFFYFTLLATAFRYGPREALMTLALNTGLTIVLYAFAPQSAASVSNLVIAIYYLVFSALLGVMLAHWARENLDLALVRSEALRQAGERARSLLQRLMHAHEAERKHVAGEIHDRLGGRLFMLQQGIGAAADNQSLDAATRATLQSLATEVRAVAGDVRAMMNDLRPTVLDEFGLDEALREYVAALQAASFDIVLDIDPAFRARRSDTDMTLFRIVQESLLNVRKHAAAKHVQISLRPVEREVELVVADDGEGFDPDAVAPRHFGLLTMRERTEALGGRMTIESAWGVGTKVIVRIPMGGRA